MSEQLDYVNNRIEEVQEEKLNRYLSGNLPSQSYEFDRGYLKALQDVLSFQQEYVMAKRVRNVTDEDYE